MAEEKYDKMCKIMVIGESGVGKTCILQRFIRGDFAVNHLTTIAIDFKIKICELKGVRLKMQIWDTAGQERFNTLTGGFYKGAHGIVLVYSVIDEKSFQNVEKWMTQIQTNAPNTVKIVLVANKSDMQSDRAVSVEDGRELAERYRIPFMETSAFNGENVAAVFDGLGERILADLQLGEESTQLQREKGRGCCA